MPYRYLPAKLLVTVVEAEYGETVIAAAKQAGAPGGTKASGRGLADYKFPGGRPKADLEEKVIFTVIQDGWESIVEAVKLAALANRFTGRAIVIDVPKMLMRPGCAPALAEGNELKENEDNDMESGATLIIGIINHGQADEIMAVARNAGAKGGTIINARGTGTVDDVKFFGISLAPEKEILMIVAEKGDAPAILEAVSGLPVFSEPGGGIVFTTKVDQFIVLGR
jgi:nitrogen regulatory protein PII